MNSTTNGTTNGVFLEPGAPTWREALTRLSHDVYHTPEYLKVCALQNCDFKPVCYLWRSEGTTGIIPLLISDCPAEVYRDIGGGADAASPYGYGGPLLVADDGSPVSLELLQRFFSEFSADCKRKGMVSVFLRGHPLLSSACKPFDGDSGSESGTTYGISLNRDIETIFSSYRSAFRRTIKKLEKAPSLRMVWDSWGDIDSFVQVYHQNMSRLQAASHYFFEPAYFRALQEYLPGVFHLLSVFDGETYIGGVCFFFMQGIVQYHLPACVNEWRDAGLPKLLVHELVKWGKQYNCSIVHLGGGVGGKDNSLAYFKSGFCDVHLPFRTYRIIIDSGKYNAGCRVAHEHAECHGFRLNEEYFPQYRASLIAASTKDVAA